MRTQALKSLLAAKFSGRYTAACFAWHDLTFSFLTEGGEQGASGFMMLLVGVLP